MKRRKAVPGAIAPGNNEQVQQLRKNALQQVADLKQKIHEIQQQSLKAMHESIDNFYKSQAQESLAQLAQQEEEILEEAGQFLTEGETDAVEDPAYEYLEPQDEYTAIEETDAGKQAMQIANKGVEDAMRSAMQSVEQAEQAVSDLSKKSS